MTAKFTHCLFLLGLITLLQACVSVPASKPTGSLSSFALHQAHLQQLQKIEQFTLKGRIGVQNEGKGFSAGIYWQHTQTQDAITLYSPLGSEIAHIAKTATEATFTDAKGQTFTAPDTETLLQNTLGWKLPLTGLIDWALGRPAPLPKTLITWNDSGQITRLIQADWNIEYPHYTEQQSYILPSKIFLKNERIQLKLLVEQWTTGG